MKEDALQPPLQDDILPPGLKRITPKVCSRVLLYVQGLDIAPITGVELAIESLRRADALTASGAPREESERAFEQRMLRVAMHELHKLLVEKGLTPHITVAGDKPLVSAPPMNRRLMLAEEMDTFPLRSFFRRLFGNTAAPGKTFAQPEHPPSETAWKKTAGIRRFVLLLLLIFPTLVAAGVMHSLLPGTGLHILRFIITGLFTILFLWISVGFWSSAAGLVMVLRRFDRFSLTRDLPKDFALPDGFKTALLFPIYNEDAKSVAAGIRTLYRSLKDLGNAQHYDIFILSDSTSPDAWILEEEAWRQLCREEGAHGNIFYRRRKSNLKRKSGNIADFCRRWGANYRYMIVFDADSLISAQCVTRMVQAMEAHPSVGILQTAPKLIRSRSLIARAQQFANHLYGPIFAAGLQYWQLGDAQYWGHNSIIRVEPFMLHCQLPTLPGKAPFGGEIMSHDFVESALMRRAGYGVWLAYDIEGSYEQSPPSLIDELVRDRRWCQGNLQHSRLLFTRGFFPTHRALFINGIMSYVSALLWFFFLVASSAQAVAELFIVPDYFSESFSLFPNWPEYFPHWALTLFSGTLTLLFLPKLFAVALVLARGGAAAFGGGLAMTCSMLGEVLLSTLLAPTRMLYHSIFVLGAFFGFSGGWNAQNRSDSGTLWSEALRFHWPGTLLGATWGAALYMVNPGFFYWMSPIVAGLVLSIPFSVWSSRVSLGRSARRLGLFLTPADIKPERIILQYEKNLQKKEPYSPFSLSRNEGFIRAVVVPRVFSLHITLTNHRRNNSPAKLERLAALRQKALDFGPDTLSKTEKIGILADPDCMEQLHAKVWELDTDAAAAWGIR